MATDHLTYVLQKPWTAGPGLLLHAAGNTAALIHAAGEAPGEVLQADLYQAADYIAEVLQGTEPPIVLHNTPDPF